MILYAFDPGETTGFGIFDLDTDPEHIKGYNPFPSIRLPNIVAIGELGGWDDLIMLEPQLQQTPPDLIIIEDFVLFRQFAVPKTGSHFPEIQILGALTYICTKNRLKYILQQPSVKTAVRGELDRRWPEYLEPYSEHERDVIVHATYYYWQNYIFRKNP